MIRSGRVQHLSLKYVAVSSGMRVSLMPDGSKRYAAVVQCLNEKGEKVWIIEEC